MAYQKKTKSFVYNSSFNGYLKNINLKPKKYVQQVIGPLRGETKGDKLLVRRTFDTLGLFFRSEVFFCNDP